MPVPWILLQLSDSALPTGGFVHSAGLESAYQQGEIRGAADLRRFIRDALWLTGNLALPLVSAAHQHPESLPRLDARADAFLASEVANRESRSRNGYPSRNVRLGAERMAPLRMSTWPAKPTPIAARSSPRSSHTRTSERTALRMPRSKPFTPALPGSVRNFSCASTSKRSSKSA